MKWSKKEEQKVKDLIVSGETYENISLLLNRTTRSIKEKANKLGYSYLKYNEIEHIDKNCPICGNVFVASKKDKQQTSQIFCSQSCSATHNNKIRKNNIKYYCVNCDKEIKHKGKFCNSKCQWDYTYNEYIKKWKSGKEDGMSGEYSISKHIRKYLYEKYNSSCSRCGWNVINHYTGKIPLEVEHIDGNHKNNKEENLDLICPNCHSLTETYKGANKGKGRKERNKYWQNRNKYYDKIEKKQNYCGCGKKISPGAKKCIKCHTLSQRTVERPNHKILIKELKELGYTGVGRKYGVSDNAIRKWETQYKKLDYKNQ